MKLLKKIGLLFLSPLARNNCNGMYCSTQCNAKKYSSDSIQSMQGMQGNNINDEYPKMTISAEPMACTLTAKELFERKELLRKDIFIKVKNVEEIDYGYIFSFQYEHAFLRKMMDYIITENDCCPFFTFDTRLHSKDDALLKITGPSKRAKEMIGEFLNSIN